MFTRSRRVGICWSATIPAARFRRTMPAGRLGDGIEVGDRPRDDRGQGVIARFLKSLTQQRERPFRGGRNGVIQINAAARLSPKEFAQ
jgi:hypothetical protein